MKRPIPILAIGVALIAVPAMAAVNGAGSVKPSDIAATRTYLLARHELSQTTKGDMSTGEAAARALVSQVASQCPNVLVGAPENKATRDIRHEVLAEVIHTLEPPRDVLIAFVTKVQRLRWSNRELTYLVHGYAAKGRANAELVLPDICADGRALVASGFQTVSASTTRLLRQSNAANNETIMAVGAGERATLGEIIFRMLKPYERPDEKALIPRQPSKREREKAEDFDLNRIFSPALKIVHTLGLSVQSGGGGSPTEVLITPPPQVVQAGPQQLAEFNAGEKVAAQSGCLACHKIGVNGNNGPGPQLTHIAARLPRQGIERTLIDPTSPMPSFKKLPKAKFKALVAFLAVLK